MRLLFLAVSFASLLSLPSLAAPPAEGTQGTEPTQATAAAAPFFREGDVVALVGGEDMVVAAELGYLEALIQRALPAHKLKFRSLAWEGDTVFEQPRQVNYPTLEAQLDDIGATVVICQFGQMESLAGQQGDTEFVSSYLKLTARLNKGGARRIALLAPIGSRILTSPPTEFELLAPFMQRNLDLQSYTGALNAATSGGHPPFFQMDARIIRRLPVPAARPPGNARAIPYPPSRPGPAAKSTSNPDLLHALHAYLALSMTARLDASGKILPANSVPVSELDPFAHAAPLLSLVAEKNRLWYHYYRPQNWAFLAGDRTNQPSSRDHLDLSKRWFPEEMKQWLPLIEAKEKDIWALAAKLAQEGK